MNQVLHANITRSTDITSTSLPPTNQPLDGALIIPSKTVFPPVLIRKPIPSSHTTCPVRLCAIQFRSPVGGTQFSDLKPIIRGFGCSIGIYFGTLLKAWLCSLMSRETKRDKQRMI